MLPESNRSKTPALGCYQGADSFGLFNLSELLSRAQQFRKEGQFRDRESLKLRGRQRIAAFWVLVADSQGAHSGRDGDFPVPRRKACVGLLRQSSQELASG
jgi:hypothetical protein